MSKDDPEKNTNEEQAAEALKQQDNLTAQIREQNKKADRLLLRRTLDKELGDFDDLEPEEAQSKEDQERKRGIALRAQRAADKKRKRRIVYAIIGFFVFLLLWDFLFSAYKAYDDFGLCRAFIEQQVQYPSEHLRISEIETFGASPTRVDIANIGTVYIHPSIRIWFQHTDGYGVSKLEAMRCYFRGIEEGEQLKYGGTPLVIDRVTQNRRDVDPKKVDLFNRSILAVLASKPDLTIPAPLPDSLGDLKFQVRAFRAIRLD